MRNCRELSRRADTPVTPAEEAPATTTSSVLDGYRNKEMATEIRRAFYGIAIVRRKISTHTSLAGWLTTQLDVTTWSPSNTDAA